MKILTVENIPYDLNKMPQTVSDDMAFSVLDNSNPHTTFITITVT